MILKIDRYDNFVHSYGSYTADKIFLAVANAVQIQLRGMDMAVKHDEGSIALLLIGTDEIQAEIVAKRIHKAVNQLVLNDQKLNEKYTISIGVAEMANEDYAELLIARTQAALDRATNDGGNQTSH